MERETNESGLSVTERVFLVLEHCAVANRTLSLAELGIRTGMAKSTLHRGAGGAGNQRLPSRSGSERTVDLAMQDRRFRRSERRVRVYLIRAGGAVSERISLSANHRRRSDDPQGQRVRRGRVVGRHVRAHQREDEH